jgi:hypothetical protein
LLLNQATVLTNDSALASLDDQVLRETFKTLVNIVSVIWWVWWGWLCRMAPLNGRRRAHQRRFDFFPFLNFSVSFFVSSAANHRNTRVVINLNLSKKHLISILHGLQHFIIILVMMSLKLSRCWLSDRQTNI